MLMALYRFERVCSATYFSITEGWNGPMFLCRTSKSNWISGDTPFLTPLLGAKTCCTTFWHRYRTTKPWNGDVYSYTDASCPRLDTPRL